jgi:hypothetical protein
MRKYPLIGGNIVVVVLLVLGSLTNVVGNQFKNSAIAYDSPLFSIRTQRTVNQGSRITLASKYLGKDSGSTLRISIQESTMELIQKFIEMSSEMNDNEFNRLQRLILSEGYEDVGSNINQYDNNAGTAISYGVLSGHVTDSEMNPIEGARVRVYFHDTYQDGYSDSTGQYHVSGIPRCSCLKNATCSKVGYYHNSTVLANGENATRDFVLAPLPVYPTLRGTMGDNEWYVSNVMVTFVSSRNDGFYYALDEDPWTAYTAPFQIGIDGIHVLHWFWGDDQGSSEVYWMSLKIDKTLPTATITVSPLNRLRTIWLMNATVFEETSGVDRVEFYVNNTLVGTDFHSPDEMFWRGLMFGKSVKIITFDKAGNSEKISLQTMSLNPQQPQSQSGSNQFSMSHGTVSGYVTDSEMNPVEGARIRAFFHDTYSEGYSDSTGYYSVSIVPLCGCLKNVTCSKLGYYPKYIWLTTNGSTSHNFVLTPMPLYPVLNGSTGEDGWFVSAVTVGFTGNDSLNHSYYALDEGAWTEYTAPFQVGTDGKHVLHWLLGDENSSGVHWVNFKTDRTAPTIVLMVTAQNLFKNIWLMNATVTDATSGVVKVEFYVDDYLVGEAFVDPWDYLYQGRGKFPQAIVYDVAGNSKMSPTITSYIPHYFNQIHSNSQQKVIKLFLK